MDINAIQNAFKSAVANSVRLQPQGIDRYQIFTPFQFDDGDHFVIALRQGVNGKLVLTDEGHTYMHMSYYMDLSKFKSGTRNQLIEGALERHQIMENQGEIFAEIDDLANAGDIFYNFIQCLVSITDVSYLNRETVASLFMDDFSAFLKENIASNRMKFNYHNPKHDPAGKYPVDCRINSMAKPLHVYGINNDNKCRDTTIYMLKFQEWDTPFQSLAIFEDQEKISRKVLSRFTDICDHQFPSLETNKKEIRNHLQKYIDN